MEVPVFSDFDEPFAWEERDEERVLLTDEEPLTIAENEVGYPLSVECLNEYHNAVESVWVVDSMNQVVRRFSIDKWRGTEARDVLLPPDGMYRAIPTGEYEESHPLGQVESVIEDTK